MRKSFAIFGCLFLLGFLIGFGAAHYYFDKLSISSDFYNLRLADPAHKLISPVLLSGLSVPGDTAEFKEIEDTLKLQTYDSLNISGMQNISIYFKDFKSGLWAGVEENEAYDPASLLKVPIMIAWLKKAESNPAILSSELIWTGSPNDNKGLDFYTLKPGEAYSVDELLRLMITKSDNDAKDLLLTNLNEKDIDTVFTDIGLTTWGIAPGQTKTISPAMFSRFLRVLYNSSYLSRDLSEKALELLSQSDFNSGIVAGVPKGVVVAHKFGQYSEASPLSPIELHDCGIIYNPEHPYLLCVMTRGSVDISILESIIKNISSTVFTMVSTKLK